MSTPSSLTETVLTPMDLGVEGLRTLEPLVAPIGRRIVDLRFQRPHPHRRKGFEVTRDCKVLMQVGVRLNAAHEGAYGQREGIASTLPSGQSKFAYAGNPPTIPSLTQ